MVCKWQRRSVSRKFIQTQSLYVYVCTYVLHFYISIIPIVPHATTSISSNPAPSRMHLLFTYASPLHVCILSPGDYPPSSDTKESSPHSLTHSSQICINPSNRQAKHLTNHPSSPSQYNLRPSQPAIYRPPTAQTTHHAVHGSIGPCLFSPRLKIVLLTTLTAPDDRSSAI